MSDALSKLREQAVSQLNDCGVKNIDQGRLDTLVDRMKTIAANKDATLVSGSDDAELETVRKNFVVKHLGVEDKDKAMNAIKEVASDMSSIRMKNRAAFYYLVEDKLK